MKSTIKKWVLVTGGTRGIGRGIVKQLSESGYDVIFTFNNSDTIAKTMEAEAATAGYFIKGYCCDARSAEEVEKFGEMMLKEYGTPYAIINNVGITRDTLLINMPTEHWHEVINANIHSTFYMTKRFLAAMMEQGDGCIIQMSSVAALRGNRGQTNYSATKAALLGFSQSLAVEVGRFNIRANVVAPGFIATEMVESIPEIRIKGMVKNIPLGRLGKVEDVANMVDFLISPKASYITGQTFVIDGGITI